MSNLSQDDLLYGTTRRLVPDSVYSVGESGEFNLQPASSSSVMTMTNFTGEDSGGTDCEECEDALENCIEDKSELINDLNTCNTYLETCNTALETCNTELAAANQTINCLEELLTPETLGGAGSWEHSTTSLKPAYPFDPISCTANLKSNISAEAVGMNGSNVTIKWTRVNNDPACQASGSITWIISPNRSGTPNYGPSWSGNRGDTTVVNKDYAAGTYYIYAYGGNLDANVNGEQYQAKGTFVVSTSGAGEPNIERTFEVTNTVVEGEELPCV